jgi:hypothetical protein
MASRVIAMTELLVFVVMRESVTKDRVVSVAVRESGELRRLVGEKYVESPSGN